MNGQVEPQRSSALKWVLIGCGGLTVVALLCIGGCFILGTVVWKKAAEEMRRELEEVRPAAEAYLRDQREIQEAVGAIVRTEAHLLESRVHKSGRDGAARLVLSVEAAKGRFKATVWLELEDGKWKGVGCEVEVGGKRIRIGHEVHVPEPDIDWDD